MRNIARHGLGTHTRLLHLTGHGLCRLTTLCIDHHNVTTRLGQRVANTLTKTTIPTGDNGYCALELHRSSPQCMTYLTPDTPDRAGAGAAPEPWGALGP